MDLYRLKKVAKIFEDMQSIQTELNSFAFSKKPYDKTAAQLAVMLREGNNIMGKRFAEITKDAKFT